MFQVNVLMHDMTNCPAAILMHDMTNCPAAILMYDMTNCPAAIHSLYLLEYSVA
jgi:hypothetical protein